MAKTIDVRVVQQCHFPRRQIREIGNEIIQRFHEIGTTVHLLAGDSAMAIVWSGLATEKGPTEEVRDHAKRIAPVAAFLRDQMDTSKRLSEQYDPLSVWLPDWKYEIGMWLKHGETRRGYIHTGLVRPYNGATRVACRLIYRVRSPEARLKALIVKWYEEACTTGFGKECFNDTRIDHVKEDDAFRFDLENYYPSTFPWLELYLRLRAALPRGQWPNAITFEPLGPSRPEIALARTGQREAELTKNEPSGDKSL
jgi:hypothetical protein